LFFCKKKNNDNFYLIGIICKIRAGILLYFAILLLTRTDDIYKVISGLVKDSDEKLTVNLFRKWIDENREIIQTHYKNLP
jgi:hypothetical protein